MEINARLYGCLENLNLASSQAEAVVIKISSTAVNQVPKGEMGTKREFFPRIVVFGTSLCVNECNEIIAIGF